MRFHDCRAWPPAGPPQTRQPEKPQASGNSGPSRTEPSSLRAAPPFKMNLRDGNPKGLLRQSLRASGVTFGSSVSINSLNDWLWLPAMHPEPSLMAYTLGGY